MILTHMTRSLRETFPGRASEWALAAILVNWSLILTVNDALLVLTPSLRPLASIMHQETWAIMCGIAGAGRLVVLGINGAWRRTPHLRALGAFVATGLWFMITIGLIQSGRIGTALAVYPVLLLLDSYNVIRAMGEAGISDANHKRAARNGNFG